MIRINAIIPSPKWVKYLKKESIIYNLLENEKCMANKIDYFIGLCKIVFDK